MENDSEKKLKAIAGPLPEKFPAQIEIIPFKSEMSNFIFQTDENTTKMLDEYTKAKKAEKNESEEGKEDQNSEEKITEKIRLLIESTDPNLLKMTEESEIH